MTDMLERSLKKAFIDHQFQGSHYDPYLIINDVSKKEFMLNVIHEELVACTDFFFSVAFVTQDGLAALKTQLADLHKKGIQGRLLTSVYLAFNKPEVFNDLLNIPNIDVRISKKEGFHSKGYMFTHNTHHSIIVGSSNLTMSALKINYEWNVKLTSYNHGQMIQDIHDHMESEWQQAEVLTRKWIEDYQKNYDSKVDIKAGTLTEDETPYIRPNTMQKQALSNIRALRARGADKGLVISATGTGKTFLSAFDVNQFSPDRVLFIVHREQILNKAKEDYMKILGGQPSDYGILSGAQKDFKAKYLFATIQTLSKESVYSQFLEEHFDYILIDEVHKAGAVSYHKVIDYFSPKFLLGMTATPERTDGFNIFELFDYNIAYEIRLQEALEEDMLCPFHYFGVTDHEKNGELISEKTDFSQLIEKDRVNFLMDKLSYYGCSRNKPKGLVFCSRKKEAQALADRFNANGMASTYLSGEDSLQTREDEVSRLEKGEISYIFTVDIFNEGIDIPKINQVVMLRNTQSSIIFIQQLGRGLRKDPSKEYVTVIDFIGNYKNNYLIPMALSGDVSRNKNKVRKDTYDTDFISGVSSINFEEIAKKQIFESIDQTKMDAMQELRKAFNLLYNRLGRVPYLKDFKEQAVLDPVLLSDKKKSYYGFLESMKENEATLSEKQQKYLVIASRELLPGIRLHELLLLKKLIREHKKGKNTKVSIKALQEWYSDSGIPSSEKTVRSVLGILDLCFFTGMTKKTYGKAPFISVQDSKIDLSIAFKSALSDRYFHKLFMDSIETGLLNAKEYDPEKPLTLYQKYKRREVLKLLNWKEQMVDQNIGGYTANDGEFVIFVTLEKGASFTGALMAYEDELLDSSTMKWFTKSPRTLKSPEVEKLKDPSNWTYRLFVKKSDDEGSDFYYLGVVEPIQSSLQEIKKYTQEGKEKSVVTMDLKLQQPIENSLYRYLLLKK
ncbi:PLD-like domain-containing protein [Alkalibacterium subtropicum]|uniref:PLD-like domain-containing protein n=1 Tax=Alkalibacterium subtropicum TaxID=753702 RepID=A0A1I1JX75_9LACT|nr:DEAD/DEAH box helicase [Alkalibacterium subtropicum]SFC49960.1 PLD-like domain-containing protein [Alkalibacterium subtropicum]